MPLGSEFAVPVTCCDQETSRETAFSPALSRHRTMIERHKEELGMWHLEVLCRFAYQNVL